MIKTFLSCRVIHDGELRMTLLAHGSTHEILCSDIEHFIVLCTMKVLDLQEDMNILLYCAL